MSDNGKQMDRVVAGPRTPNFAYQVAFQPDPTPEETAEIIEFLNIVSLCIFGSIQAMMAPPNTTVSPLPPQAIDARWDQLSDGAKRHVQRSEHGRIVLPG